MEHTLRCNTLKCRVELGDRALVTTCSHIFCLDCASRFGLTSQGNEQRRACPACHAQLTNPDDAVISNLNPTEDYKTSVLSGLSPNVIMECAGRALSFWAYQSTQEIVYQEHLGKILTEKYSGLSIHLDKIINEANAEMSNLQNKLDGMSIEQDDLRRKHDDLLQVYKEKNRKLLQIQELYDKLKQKAMLGQVQVAASDAVDSTLHGATGGGLAPPSLEGRGPHQSFYQQQASGPPYRGLHAGVSTVHQPYHASEFPPISLPASVATNSWKLSGGAQATADMPMTPSTHRMRAGNGQGIGLPSIPGAVTGTPASAHGLGRFHPPPPRVDHANHNGNPGGFSGMGLTSGLRTSQGARHAAGFAVPSGNRPRGE